MPYICPSLQKRIHICIIRSFHWKVQLCLRRHIMCAKSLPSHKTLQHDLLQKADPFRRAQTTRERDSVTSFGWCSNSERSEEHNHLHIFIQLSNKPRKKREDLLMLINPKITLQLHWMQVVIHLT